MSGCCLTCPEPVLSFPMSVLGVCRRRLTSDGLWVPYARRKSRVYQPRHRRDCLGELIQIDGSHHDCFEGREPKCCLLVFIDDATTRLMHLRFSKSETAFDYMLATQEYVEQHGKPVSLYSDKHVIVCKDTSSRFRHSLFA